MLVSHPADDMSEPYNVFCLVDDQMQEVPKHSQAKLYPSELVTIGLLFALKGGHFRTFYRWLKRDYEALLSSEACCIPVFLPSQ
ncbi:hypothetical protein Krac_11457 [Ktedonobacter racemifer DSM 44963]|uniref:Uncharacterized protein n=1 Tax=Ktedonobacter racemifer DSM 44963 TaxID=485913 RepID=D6TBU0_KTERA|nr:hypothetical protein Krac_11457 [Ktedonobacter racemifer DSM 44963]